MKDDDWDIMLEAVDAVFRFPAEETVVRENIPLEDAQEGMWALFEAGFIRLVGHGDGMGIEPCLGRTERRTAAKQNRPLANYRRLRLAESPVVAPVDSVQPRPWVALSYRNGSDHSRD